MNNKILNIFIDKKPQTPPPVWCMRQAGRYLPEYRHLRETYSFKELCYTPELMTEVTLLPLRRFSFDAAIMFSDILVVLDALGYPFFFDEGLKVSRYLPADPLPQCSCEVALDKLAPIFSGIHHIKKALDKHVALFGFVGGPFTVLSYLIEGGPTSSFRNVLSFLHTLPDKAQKLLNILTDITCAYVKKQIESGVDVIQVFDSHAGILDQTLFSIYSAEPLRRIKKAAANTPMVAFCRGAALHIPSLYQQPYAPDGINIDFMTPISWVDTCIPSSSVLQGGINPFVLLGSHTSIREQVSRYKEGFAHRPYIFNLGHGLSPDTPPENLQFFLECVHAC